jgi:hypothetical protein
MIRVVNTYLPGVLQNTTIRIDAAGTDSFFRALPGWLDLNGRVTLNRLTIRSNDPDSDAQTIAERVAALLNLAYDTANPFDAVAHHPDILRN